MSLAVLNNAPDAQFLELIGGPLEGQIWLAERVSAYRPFGNVEALIAVFEQVVNDASETEHIALISSHPDLAGKAALEKPLSTESVREQTAAGLTSLTPEQYVEFHELNSDYKAKFGFPFVICARENTRETILASYRTRRHHTREQEIAIAVAEVLKILRLRLIDQYA